MTIVCVAIQLFLLVVFIRIIMSWFPPTPGTTYSQIYDFFYRVTEPVLGPIRQVIPPLRIGMAGLDLSPIIVFLVGTVLLRALC